MDIHKTPVIGKYRLKVLEQNDGTKMYCPQIYCCTDFSYRRKYWLFGERQEFYGYEWKSFHIQEDGIEVSFSKNSDGCSSSNIEDANNIIEKYKIDSDKRYAERRKRAQDENDKKIKNIEYIDIK